MRRCHQPLGEGLLTAVTALSIAISQGKTAEEIELLASVFNVMGENLALLALHAPNDPCAQ